MIPREILKKIRQVEIRTNRIVQSEVLLCLALMLGGVSASCSATERHTSTESAPDLYLHIFASYRYPELPRLTLSAPIPLSGDFDIPINDNQHLKGHIEPRSGNYFVHFQTQLCSGTNVFDGKVELEKRYEPWPQPYDAKAPFICQPHFVLSANANPKSFLNQQAAAEKKQWHLKNPLTARQLAEVKRKFHLLRPGKTEDELFAMLGLSRYRNLLLPCSPFSPNRLNFASYQLGEGVKLIFHFDHADDKNNRIVIYAQLGMETWSKEDGFNHVPPIQH